MREITPAPCSLTVHRDLVLVVKGTRGVELRRGRRVVDKIAPAIIAQFQLSTVVADDRFGDLIGPSRFIPYQVWIVGGNRPCVPSARRVGNTEGQTAVHIRLGIAVGSAPITQSRLVGENASGDLGIRMSVNANCPIDFSGTSVGSAPFCQYRRGFLLGGRFYLNGNKAVKVNGVILLREVDTQCGTDRNVRTVVYLFVEYKGDQARIRDLPAANIGSVLQDKITFAAIHQQTVGDLILIGSRQETLGAVEGNGQLVAFLGLGNVVSVFILGQFHIVEVQQCIEIVAAVGLQIRNQFDSRAGRFQGEVFRLHLRRIPFDDEEGRAMGDIQQVIHRWFCFLRRRFRRLRRQCFLRHRCFRGSPANNGRIAERHRLSSNRILQITADHTEGSVIYLGDNANCVVVKKYDVTALGNIVAHRGVLLLCFPKLCHGRAAGAVRKFCTIRTCIIQAERHKHG